MDPADSVWYQQGAVPAFLNERVRQEAWCARRYRLALGGPCCCQTTSATAVHSPNPPVIRLCSFSHLQHVLRSPAHLCPRLRFPALQEGWKKDYVTENSGLTLLQSFALFVGFPCWELHKIPASSTRQRVAPRRRTQPQATVF